ncbi:H-NS family nucleoid-associated regulatory protein [Desulfosediminicola flagellatus]|uniref:H-NS histone family protein n=1 Tax=Desulfosediminicola flagellatus TaxID=2569541 RepID=UPI0010AC91A6|nr:H-NS family nucleoid-associated regulatory protein [Desulfosediminicola flagellatus]
MEDFVKIITHARRFKSATKGFSLEQLQEVKTKLDTIIDDRIAEAEEAKRANAEKIEKIEKYREMMAADGIELEDLADEAPVKKGKRAPRPPKYGITNDAGEYITWTGQGRMPNVFKTKVDAGQSIDTFLIK